MSTVKSVQRTETAAEDNAAQSLVGPLIAEVGGAVGAGAGADADADAGAVGNPGPAGGAAIRLRVLPLTGRALFRTASWSFPSR